MNIKELKEKLLKREISSVEIVQDCIKKAKESDLNAFITITEEKALEQAKKADIDIKNGDDKLLLGIPIAVKDLFCTKNIRTSAASKMLENFIPPYESTVTKNLFNNGAVMVGKVNLDEFAMGSANITSYFGAVKSPLKNSKGEHLSPGGSSGGSSAAVAANLCAGALGTDTGGSIRQPASFTGIVGIKPTYGRCSRFGAVAFASSLDQAGPMARTVYDSALILQSIAGFDEHDSTSSNRSVPNWVGDINPNIKGKKIGIPKEYVSDLMDKSVTNLWQKTADDLKSLGAEIIDISLPYTKYALPAYYIIAPAEASSNLARYDGVRYGYRAEGPFESLDDMYEKTRAEGFGDEVKRRILIGTYVLSAGYFDAYYKKAQKIRSLVAADFSKAFKKVDAILTPTTPTAAFTVNNPPTDPVTMYLNDIFTVPASLAGIPAISLPAGKNKEGLPLGMQLISNNFNEQILFDIGTALGY